MTATNRRSRFDFHSFAPRKPRHPLMRLALGLLGLGVLLLLVFFSVFVGIAMLAVGLVYRLLKQRGKPVARDARIVDGEFHAVGKRVVGKHALRSPVEGAALPSA